MYIWQSKDQRPMAAVFAQMTIKTQGKNRPIGQWSTRFSLIMDGGCRASPRLGRRITEKNWLKTDKYCPPRSSVEESRTPGGESPRSRRCGAWYLVLLTGMACGRWQRPQPIGVSEWGGPCPAMWAHLTLGSKFCRLPRISRSDCKDNNLYKGKGNLCNQLYLARALSSSIRPFKMLWVWLLLKIIIALVPRGSDSRAW